MSTIRILVTGAGGAPGANFISSLRLVKNRKLYIVGADINKYHLELTAGLDKKYLLPKVDSPDYLEKLNTLIKKESIDFVHLQTEQEVWFLSNKTEKLLAKTLLPPRKTLEITTNKNKLSALLKKNGLNTPQSFHIQNKKDLKEKLNILLKDNAKVWLRATHGAGSKASLPVNSLLQAEGWIDYWTNLRELKYEDFMVSEFLPGKEFAFQSIWYKGKLITSMARERVEYLFGQLFPSGQSSSPSIAKTVHRTDINKLATKIITLVDKQATGIFCVDIKEDKNGKPCVTEINAGRFFTTSNNFSTAGLNMPYYYVLLGLKQKLPSLPKYNGIPAGWYWLRMVDMGYKLVKGEKWTSTEL